MGTIVVGSILVIVVTLVLTRMIRDKKNGKSHCDGDCGNCSGHCR